MPRLLRFLGLHIAFGVAVGIAAAAVALLVDAGGLKTLMVSDQQPYLAMIMLFAGFSITFGSIAVGAAIMRLPWGEIIDMQQGHDRGPKEPTSNHDDG